MPKKDPAIATLVNAPEKVLPQRKIAGYGWRPDTLDPRDFALEDTAYAAEADLPREVDLRTTSHFDTPYDQGQLGSCTGNGIAAVMDFSNHAENGSFLTPSRLFIYWNERYIENTVSQDAGAEIRDGLKVVAKQGVCPESEWRYDIAKFADQPTAACYQAAVKDEALAYKRVNKQRIRSALAAGYPVVFGFTVYESFESQQVAADGIVPMPGATEGILGGHCVVAVGYKQINGRYYIICRNSWGPGWGDGGYFYLPLAYIEAPYLCSDFWTITRTGAAAA